MGQDSSSGGTQVVTQSPPEYQLPFLERGMAASGSLFDQGGPTQYGGNTVVPFAPQTEAALAGTVARASSGSPVVGAGQDFVRGGLTSPVSSGFGFGQNPYASSPNMFGGASNPHLDATFNMMADRSQNRLSSEFARAGRNIDASAPARAGMLADIAAQVYAPAYENERNRQLQYQGQLTGIGASGYENERSRMLQDLTAQRSNQMGLLPYVTPLAEQDYRDLAALRGVGAEVEGQAGAEIDDAVSRYNFEQQRPESSLDAYLQRILGNNMGGTETSQLPDVYRNRGAGALGGAMAGGSMFGPWGALGGLLLGGLL